MKQSFSLFIIWLIALIYSIDLTAQNEFITTWKTDNPGITNSTSIRIPTTGGGYNYDIDWDNDGNFDQFGVTGTVTHDFGTAGIYTIRIKGNFPRIYFNNAGDRRKIIEINQWGTIAWTSMDRAFFGCSNLELNTTMSDAPDFSNVSFISLASMFRGASSFNGSINHWDVSNAFNMQNMFYGATSFNQNLSSWDVSNVRIMISMFYGATSFNQDIGAWDVSKVENMINMFFGATSFDQDLSNWDVSNVYQMINMFRDVTLSTNNYDNLLIGWNSLPLRSGVTFHGGNSQYCSPAAVAARANMIASDNWNIIDGGKTPPTAVCISTPITIYLDNSGNATLLESDIDNGSTLNCGGTLGLSLSQTTFTCLDIGSNTVTLTVDDGEGNTSTCDTTVIVEDNSAIAGTDQTTMSCDVTTVTLSANSVTGLWTASPDTGYFSDVTAFNSDFTGESGTTYTLTWTSTSTSPCGDPSDTIIVTIPDCGNSLAFEGVDEYISFGNNYNLNSSFSIEAWIKPDNFSGTKTIFSKRDGTSTASGYDLSLIGNLLNFRYNNSTIIATETMNTNKWYHIAVTFNGSTYLLYVDGFKLTSANGSLPNSNTNNALIGAMDRTGNLPINHFSGGIDEVRMWNIALSQDQIREMMNQEIKQNNAYVMGQVIPINITGDLLWNNLIGYYQMATGPHSSVVSGIINDISTVSPVSGNINAMTTIQNETAPIPYISQGNSWDDGTAWSTGYVQQIPNSSVNNIIPNNLQTWNIVRTTTDMVINRPTISPNSGKTIVSGLIVDNNRLSVTNDQLIKVDKYLKIDGTLDLVGESQLLQSNESVVDYTGTGQLERDQQGTSNLFNYNYWSSPVSNGGISYTIANTFLDGSNTSNPQTLQWTNSYNANPATNPITISRRWLYLYENYLENNYASWNDIDENTTIPVGLGYTMKGSGNSNSTQNYVYRGQPNNGTIYSPISSQYQALVGNPYPSAIDVNTFIDDNNAVLKDGSISIWEHASSNSTHILSQYEGGYAVRNKLGGIPAVSPPEINGTGTAIKVPGRFIPIAQGFFVTGNATGGFINFNNNQREFAVENGTNSLFFRNLNNLNQTVNSDKYEDDNQYIRINFLTPEGATRYLLIGFMNNQTATDDIDYGYDALNTENLPSDLSFKINNENYVIQGVGEFDESKTYPLEMIISEPGHIEIALDDLENFDETIDVFIFDSVLGTYTRFNEVNFQINLEAGIYTDRFYLAFQEDTTLSTIKDEIDSVTVKYLHQTNEIYVKTSLSVDLKRLYLINVTGQTIASWNKTNLPMSHDIKIPVENISEGAYILKVETTSGTFNKKIIILNINP
ncbi:BspA family leucine-rich repeat surface protein [Winogradskyella forsetii]|uniref:BspA family leucine-rich repeat surface protein n=1 Tax=Winogradskyella forsetii TaxID=2686077 RepID=UPI0015B9DF18|nr:BspA family leucine-rich repeat surface protein [Winogradskyella forsetii]